MKTLKNRGFTLIELLIVITVLAVLTLTVLTAFNILGWILAVFAGVVVTLVSVFAAVFWWALPTLAAIAVIWFLTDRYTKPKKGAPEVYTTSEPPAPHFPPQEAPVQH